MIISTKFLMITSLNLLALKVKVHKIKENLILCEKLMIIILRIQQRLGKKWLVHKGLT